MTGAIICPANSLATLQSEIASPSPELTDHRAIIA
jgi:hypothetical protein